MILLIIIFLLLIVIIIRKITETKKRLELLRNIPGPPSVPIFGNFFVFINQNLEEIQLSFLKLMRHYGGTLKLWAFTRIILVTCHPRDIEVILSSSKLLEKNFLYMLLNNWLGAGLLLSKGKKWFNRRKIITPTFHFKILEQFVEIMDQQSSILVQKLSKKNFSDGGGGAGFDVHNLVALATLDIIAESAMGTKINAQQNSNGIYVNAVKNVTKSIAQRFIKMWLRYDFLCFIFNYKLLKLQRNATEILRKFTRNIIIARRRELEQQTNWNNNNLNNNVDEFGIKRRLAFLDVLLQSKIDGQPLSDGDIQEEVDTFMFEGHDTTTSGICFTLHLLSRHEQVQRALYEEIMNVIGTDANKSIHLRDLQNLKYLEAVIKESLRLYPPVAIIGRLLAEDTIINNNCVPKNTHVVIHLQALMRNPEIFTEPDKFIPERHLNASNDDADETKSFNPYSYIPFSAGPRNCIGQKFAMLEMKSIISKILRNYKLLQRGPEVIPLMDIILRSKTGWHLGIEKRNCEH